MDPTTQILDHLDPDAIVQRLAQLAREARHLRALLRIARSRSPAPAPPGHRQRHTASEEVRRG